MPTPALPQRLRLLSWHMSRRWLGCPFAASSAFEANLEAHTCAASSGFEATLEAHTGASSAFEATLLAYVEEMAGMPFCSFLGV